MSCFQRISRRLFLGGFFLGGSGFLGRSRFLGAAAAILIQGDDLAVVVHGLVGRERDFEVLDGFGVGGDDDGLVLFEDGVDEGDVFVLAVVVADLEGQRAMRFGSLILC